MTFYPLIDFIPHNQQDPAQRQRFFRWYNHAKVKAYHKTLSNNEILKCRLQNIIKPKNPNSVSAIEVNVILVASYYTHRLEDWDIEWIESVDKNHTLTFDEMFSVWYAISYQYRHQVEEFLEEY